MESINNDFVNLFNGIEQLAASNNKVCEGDYYVDGLLYCGRCRTAKQCRVELFGQTRTPYCLCKCESERLNREEEELKKREKMQKIERMRSMGFPESEMHKWTFAADDGADPKTTKIAMRYVEKFDLMRERGKGLLFFGTVGTGKTFHAACIANALIDRGYPCLVTNFARLVNTLQGMYEGKQEYLDSLNKFDLLVLDDLAAERDTEYMNEIIQTIVDSRYRAGLPTIVTTNLSANELKNPADVRRQRTYSRLLEMTLPIEVKGRDRRKAKLASDYDEFSDLLGL